MNWISPLTFFAVQDAVLSTHQKGTGKWLLESKVFKDWVSKPGKTMWCHGIRMTTPSLGFKDSADTNTVAGAGKTVFAYDLRLSFLFQNCF
jgi:hypothetical protein